MNNLTYIKWKDARGASPDWRELDTAKKDGVCIINSIGWVIEETDEYIQISPHVSHDPVECCGDMVIPKSAIITSQLINVTET